LLFFIVLFLFSISATAEFVLTKELQKVERKKALLFFHIFLGGSEFWGPKKVANFFLRIGSLRVSNTVIQKLMLVFKDANLPW
jgi:hypothetical protein